MSFNNLPDNVVIEILTHLSDWSKMRAMSVFERWAEIFGSTSQLIDKFKLKVTRNFVRKWKLEDLPNIPIKNVSFFGIYRENPLIRGMPILKKYESSIKAIAFKHSEFSAYDLAEILGFKKLKRLKLINVDIRLIGFYEKCHVAAPTIKSLEIRGKGKKVNNILDLFKCCASIEIVLIKYHQEFDDESDINSLLLFDFIKSLPNLKCFVFWNKEIDTYAYEDVFTKDFPAKLVKLVIGRLSHTMTIDFFRTQKDTMKELIIHEDDEKYMEYYSEVLAFILTEMNLRYFKFGKLDMIIDYERQPDSFLPFLKKPKYE